MPKLNRDGVDLYYEIHGNGPPLLLTHGFSATSEMWRGQIEALSPHVQVITWDMRGHGRSDYPVDPAAYSEAETVADMAAILDVVGAPDAIIGGLSLGGYMSLGFHAAYPERTRGLLIIDTGPGYRKDEPREGWNANALKQAERFETRGVGSIPGHRDATGLARAARGMLTQHDAHVIESLPTITVPTLVVVGADDAPFLAAADYMAGKVQGARKVVIEKAGHVANVDQPAAFNAAVLAFLRESNLAA